MNFKMLASAAGAQNLNDAAMSACGQMLAAHFSGFSWTPVTQGAISSLAIAYDANWQGGSFSGDTRIGTSALLRQGGTLFTARYSEVRTSAWQTFAGPIAPGDWCTLVSCVGAKPDFSATGGLIEFGIATSNNCPGRSKNPVRRIGQLQREPGGRPSARTRHVGAVGFGPVGPGPACGRAGACASTPC